MKVILMLRARGSRSTCELVVKPLHNRSIFRPRRRSVIRFRAVGMIGRARCAYNRGSALLSVGKRSKPTDAIGGKTANRVIVREGEPFGTDVGNIRLHFILQHVKARALIVVRKLEAHAFGYRHGDLRPRSLLAFFDGA